MPRAKDFDGDESTGRTIDITTGTGVSILSAKARNWLITQNSAEKYGVDTSKEAVLSVLAPLIEKNRISFVNHRKEQGLKADENGLHSRHDHFVIRFPNMATGGQVHRYFPHAALQPCQGNLLSIIKYINKDPSGLWYKTHPEKLGEKLPDDEADYWQWGDIPDEKKQVKPDKRAGSDLNALIIAAIIEGQSDAEIMMNYPYSWRRPAELRKARFAIMSQKYRSLYRDLHVVYVQANMPPKQLRSLYPVDRDTYVVSDYTHPWDSYCAEKTVVLLDFVGQLPWPELRRLMSGNYCTLPARFSDAVACHETLIIISPISLSDFKAIKSYANHDIESYLTHIRTYDDLDDTGTYYTRDPQTHRWMRQYLLPSPPEEKKEENQ